MLLLGVGTISPGKCAHRPKHHGLLQRRGNLASGGLGSPLSSAPSLVWSRGATYCPLLNLLFLVASMTSRENINFLISDSEERERERTSAPPTLFLSVPLSQLFSLLMLSPIQASLFRRACNQCQKPSVLALCSRPSGLVE